MAKVLMIVRQGETSPAGGNPERYPLTFEAAQKHYRDAKEFFSSFDFGGGTPAEKLFVFRGNRLAGVQASLALRSGALGMDFEYQRNGQVPDGVYLRERLDVSDIAFDSSRLSSDRESYLKWWIRNPLDSMSEGVPITRFDLVVETRREVMWGAFKLLFENKKSAGIIVAPSGIAEALLLNGVPTANSPYDDLPRIGGLFKPGDYAVLEVSKNPEGYYAHFEREGIRYPFNVSMVMGGGGRPRKDKIRNKL